MSDIIFVVVSKIKKHVKEAHSMRVSEEATTALSESIRLTLSLAAERAKADKRKTIAARDLIAEEDA